MLIGLSSLLIVFGVHAKQPSASKRPALAVPAIDGPLPSEAAIKELLVAGRSIEAARLLEEHARRTPGNKTIKARVAEVYELQGDLTAAKQAAREATAGDTPNPEALAVLGRIAAREGDWANAVVYTRSVVNATPNEVSAHLNYANAGADNEYAIFRSLSGMPPIPKEAAKK
jgi:predicted Zn-dependent protease